VLLLQAARIPITSAAVAETNAVWVRIVCALVQAACCAGGPANRPRAVPV
jgi:hypothetical protein